MQMISLIVPKYMAYEFVHQQLDWIKALILPTVISILLTFEVIQTGLHKKKIQ